MDTIKVPEILLPENCDMRLWAVNACDQFTSDLNYWQRVENLVGDNPSTLNLIYPEIYLKDDTEARIERINSTMQAYLDGGIFKTISGGFILVERTTALSGTRTGIVLAIDLEDYSFENGAKTPVRSTEATIIERIPPRVQIRKNAPIELPHIMLLYNDSGNKVLNTVRRGEVLYDFELNMYGGDVKGTFIDNPEEVTKAFYSVAEDGFLFAVGDGNHSLATAKTCWEQLKPTLTEQQQKDHPARFALCEAVNIYDPALSFEPIHRFVKCADPAKFAQGLNLQGAGSARLVIGGAETQITFPADIPSGIRQLDDYISRYIAENGGEVDYIHGESELKTLTANGGAGVLLPTILKSDFFSLINKGGNLPRKTFSMGEGNEKRYYVEAKKIR